LNVCAEGGEAVRDSQVTKLLEQEQNGVGCRECRECRGCGTPQPPVCKTGCAKHVSCGSTMLQ